MNSEYDLGDGYVLRRTGLDRYKIMHGADTAGSVYIIPSKVSRVKEVMIFDPHRGKGLYRRTLPILKSLYGAIRSDNGEISDGAAKAWRAAGARSILRTDSGILYGDSWYVLESTRHLLATIAMG